MNRLKIAVTKGRLLDNSIALFEEMGFDCALLRSDTRKLILPIDNEKYGIGLDVVLSKAADVLTYVSHGACDLGIVGKDTIMEHGGSFYELKDLGFGACRFALAVPEGSDFYGTYRERVVASKYPAVTKAYFASKGMDVSVIKIEGSVELAPLVGLANGIVDIVQTGTTLKENGLSPIETVAPVTARLIVNTASMKLHRNEILALAERIDEYSYAAEQ